MNFYILWKIPLKILKKTCGGFPNASGIPSDFQLLIARLISTPPGQAMLRHRVTWAQIWSQKKKKKKWERNQWTRLNLISTVEIRSFRSWILAQSDKQLHVFGTNSFCGWFKNCLTERLNCKQEPFGHRGLQCKFGTIFKSSYDLNMTTFTHLRVARTSKSSAAVLELLFCSWKLVHLRGLW